MTVHSKISPPPQDGSKDATVATCMWMNDCSGRMRSIIAEGNIIKAPCNIVCYFVTILHTMKEFISCFKCIYIILHYAPFRMYVKEKYQF